jgi:hypothetical protein
MKVKRIVTNDISSIRIDLSIIEAGKLSLECERSKKPLQNRLNKLILKS